jgi:Mg2+ and Co2+ transporter CorA
MGCSKKFTKSDTSVQCTVCGLWIHKACADISDEIIELLEKMKKETGSMYWACKPCNKYAQGMNHRLKEIEEDLKEVKQNTKSNTEAIKQHREEGGGASRGSQEKRRTVESGYGSNAERGKGRDERKERQGAECNTARS